MDWITGFIKSFLFWHAIPYVLDNSSKKSPACIKCCCTHCQCHAEDKDCEKEINDQFYGI